MTPATAQLQPPLKPELVSVEESPNMSLSGVGRFPTSAASPLVTHGLDRLRRRDSSEGPSTLVHVFAEAQRSNDLAACWKTLVSAVSGVARVTEFDVISVVCAARLHMRPGSGKLLRCCCIR